ncbi:MAG: hypothetical protein ACRCTW_05750, partial [Lactococcus garvieae]
MRARGFKRSLRAAVSSRVDLLLTRGCDLLRAKASAVRSVIIGIKMPPYTTLHIACSGDVTIAHAHIAMSMLKQNIVQPY